MRFVLRADLQSRGRVPCIFNTVLCVCDNPADHSMPLVPSLQPPVLFRQCFGIQTRRMTDARISPYTTDQLFFKNFRVGYVTAEYFWRDHEPWLQEQGYMFRPRYHRCWNPSWAGTKKYSGDFEDGQLLPRFVVMDATRFSDGRVVVLKKVNKAVHPYEAEIGQLFSTEALAADPRNHSVPIYDVLQSPLDQSMVILVMPYLMRYHEERFGTIGEAVERFRQLFEGL